jgi:hypothetical protein
MNGPTWALDIFSSSIGGLSIVWTLLSNKSKPWRNLENPVNIVELLDFLACPPMKVIGIKALRVFLVCHPS